MARYSPRIVFLPRSTVPIGTPLLENSADITALSNNKNDTIQIEDETVPVETKGFAQYLNFTGAGVTVTASGDPNTIDITIPGGSGSGLTQEQVEGLI